MVRAVRLGQTDAQKRQGEEKHPRCCRTLASRRSRGKRFDKRPESPEKSNEGKRVRQSLARRPAESPPRLQYTIPRNPKRRLFSCHGQHEMVPTMVPSPWKRCPLWCRTARIGRVPVGTDLHGKAVYQSRRKWQLGCELCDVMLSCERTYEAEGTGLEPATPLLGHHISSVLAERRNALSPITLCRHIWLRCPKW